MRSGYCRGTYPVVVCRSSARRVSGVVLRFRAVQFVRKFANAQQLQGGAVKLPPFKEGTSVALVVVLCTAIIVSLVVLDKNNHTWMALLVYACVYVAIALVERRSGKQ